jgi:hypothetical protein
MDLHFGITQDGLAMACVKKQDLLFPFMKMNWHHRTRVQLLDKHAEPRLAGILGINEDDDLARIGRPEGDDFSLTRGQNIFRQVNAHTCVLLRKSLVLTDANERLTRVSWPNASRQTSSF